MHYEEALDAVRGLAATGVNFGLERVRELLAVLGDPQAGLFAAHIGGTNGKGSVAAMVTAMARAAGLKVGTFTSPHLSSYTERFLIDGRPVTEERLAGLIATHWNLLAPVARQVRPTEFELHTVLALQLFREERVDVAVLEVGLGGRLDATNVIRPAVAVITNVTLDHQEYLGETIAEIAREKAGIIKPGVPLVTAAEGGALDVIAGACRELDAPLVRVGADVRWEPRDDSGEKQGLDIYGRRAVYRGLALPLAGRHQQVNAACAVAAAEVLGEHAPSLGPSAIREGLAAVNWPGRFEVLAGRPTVVLDAAHNPAAAVVLRDTLVARFPGREIILVLGVLGDKDRAGIAAVLAPAARAVVVTRPPSERAGDWERVAVEAGKHCARVETVPDCRAALTRAQILAGAGGVVVVTGSIYLIGALRSAIT
ncbi:MAG: folylpolyglutamate synthase/dihydrofolate synthase family protein [Bacillota bacterium]